jgi:signal transduction histidine kinase
VENILAKALGQDVTQLATEEKQRLLGRLLGRLAHEIRNPLSSLDIHVQLLDEDLGALAPETRDKLAGRLEIIRGELKRLERIVQHFLRLSAPSELNLQKVDLRQVIGNLCELLRPEAATRKIEIRTNIADDLPVMMGDPVQLAQALMNLTINGIQAVERDGHVEIAAHPGENSILVAVRDSGPGIPGDKALDLFDPYFTTKPEGTGLGLWIAQQIVMAHHGRIHALNAETGGAVFKIELPLSR